jgi:hypothetical protein
MTADKINTFDVLIEIQKVEINEYDFEIKKECVSIECCFHQ